MHKTLFVFTIVSTLAHALYNPFFVQDTPPQRTQVQKKEIVYKDKKPVAARKSIDMSYFGFVSSTIGEFALVSFNGKNIIINQNDSTTERYMEAAKKRRQEEPEASGYPSR